MREHGLADMTFDELEAEITRLQLRLMAAREAYTQKLEGLTAARIAAMEQRRRPSAA